MALAPVNIPTSAARITISAATAAPPTPAIIPKDVLTPSPNPNTKSRMRLLSLICGSTCVVLD